MTDIRGGLYFTPPHIVDFVLGSGAYLSLALETVIGNPPFAACAMPDIGDFPVTSDGAEESQGNEPPSL